MTHFKSGIRSSLFGLLLLLAAGQQASAQPEFRGEWRCTALTPRHLALTGDYLKLQRELFRKRLEERRKMTRKPMPKWAKDYRFHISGTEAIAACRSQVVPLLRDAPKIKLSSSRGTPPAILRTGYWMNPIGQSRFPDEDGRERVSRNADTAHYLFIELDRDLVDSETLRITLPAGEEIGFVYLADRPSPLFRIDQVGYMPDAPKYAYIGAWLGTAGALPLEKYAGKKFTLIDENSRRAVFSGILGTRPRDPFTAKGSPFTGEEVLELDFSKFTATGRYHLAVEGLGRSDAFRIGNDTMAEAFYIHMRGLYHQRCGIAKERPYTHWVMPTCHRQSIRGTFPPDIAHYSKGNGKRDFGFRDESGNSIEVDHFRLIEQNRPESPEVLAFPGGWHDAGDWDRRPQHLGIVGDLAAVYLLKPENFCDGQLDLPESGNGIPDILDEACWGIEHLRLKQQPDGGVGTWEETTRHPSTRDVSSAEDKLVYYLSRATRNSTLEYAAYAAELALALKRAGAEKLSAQYRASAERAWNYALDPKNRARCTFNYNGSVISYSEEPEPSPGLLVKAGFDLFQLTDDKRFIEAAEQASKAALADMKKNSWRWSPFFWIELELFPCYYPGLNKLALAMRRSLTGQAKKMLIQQEEAYPIRVPWFGPREGWVHTMSWGTFHPLRRARVLIAAHAMTNDRRYLDGAFLANDFHNGANPFNSTMTSGLGRVYPVRFLDLNSYSYGGAEAVPGITPYRNTYGIPRNAVRMAYGLYYPKNPRHNFPGLSLSFLPVAGLDEKDCVRELNKVLPVWRRWGNVEGMTVAASEFTVWETIAPAAAVTGYLLSGAQSPDANWKNRRPAPDIRKLPGYAPLP